MDGRRGGHSAAFLAYVLLALTMIGALATAPADPRNLWVGVGAGALLALLVWYRRFADRWRSYRPAPGLSFTRVVDELPVVADHRDFFGRGTIRNVVHTPHGIGLEVLGGRGRCWFYVVQLRGAHGRWHVRPWPDNRLLPGEQPRLGDLYDVSGPVPPDVRRELLRRSDARVPLTCLDDVLVVRRPGMTGGDFPAWLATGGETVRAVARSLAELPPVEPGSPGSVDPAHNVWEPGTQHDPGPDDAAAAEPAPNWRQPPQS